MTLTTEMALMAAEAIEYAGESVSYVPAGGDARSIRAVVNRTDAAGLGVAGEAVSPQITVAVLNDETDGISSDEVDTGGDKITLALRLGETAQSRRITRIVQQDAATLIVEVR